MAKKEMLHNITYFFGTIIPEAISCSNWDENSVNQAFLWADYCQQVYEKAIDHPKSEFLDSVIKDVASDIRFSQSNISLKYLNSSTEVLLRGFLQNSMIKSSLLQFVYDKGQERGFDKCQLAQEHNEDCQLCEDIIQLFSSVLDSKSLGVSIATQTEAEFLVGDIKKEVASHSSEQKTEKWLIDFVKKMCKSKHSVEVLLHVLMLDSSEHSPHALQSVLLTYLSQLVAVNHELFDCSVAEQVWHQPARLLRSVCSKHFLFYQCYCSALINCGNSVKLEFENDVAFWRMDASGNQIARTFEDLVAHFTCLCSLPDKIATATETLLSALMEGSKGDSVWKHIVSRVKASCSS